MGEKVKILEKERAVLLKEKYLTIADLHLGYEIALMEEGIYMPRVQLKSFKERIEVLVERFEPRGIIINGDLKHKFSKHSRKGWEEIENFLNFLKEKFDRVILIRGNHDTYMEKYEDLIEIYDFFDIDDIFLPH